MQSLLYWTLNSPLQNLIKFHYFTRSVLEELIICILLLKNVLHVLIFQIGQESSGQCIPVKCDHGNDEEVKQLFDKVSREQNGRLDVLVNNAYKGVQVNYIITIIKSSFHLLLGKNVHKNTQFSNLGIL